MFNYKQITILMQENKSESTRFLRYPGGKAKLLSFLIKYLPKEEDIKGKYIEPFVGGGSVFMHVRPKKAVISDLNNELIDLYRAIKNYPHKVWEIYCSFPSGKRGYYRVRDSNFDHQRIYYRAARTLYLNRTCFKGMWRHNIQGDFNVGYGGESRRWVISHENIVELSKLFKKAKVETNDFKKTLASVRSGDYIFLDPPYKPGKKEMDHAHYINGKFSFEEQQRLALELKKISQKSNVKWAMTNSSHPAIRKLYAGFKIRRIPKGTSNVVGVFSENSNEILISNY